MVYSGTAIYLFCIIPNVIPGVTTTASYSFTLDGQDQAPYMHSHDSSTTVAYNVPVLAVSGLAHTQHHVVVTVQPIALALFDYAIFT
jgi:uncharacterized membrane protein